MYLDLIALARLIPATTACCQPGQEGSRGQVRTCWTFASSGGRICIALQRRRTQPGSRRMKESRIVVAFRFGMLSGAHKEQRSTRISNRHMITCSRMLTYAVDGPEISLL